MLTRGDISSISNAAKARDALMEARNRENGIVSRESPVVGERYKLEETAAKLPLVDQSGKVFAGPILSKGEALTIPGNVEAGNIVEYQDQTTGSYHYAQVVKKNSQKGRVEVKSVSKKEVESLKEGNSKTKIYSLSDSDKAKHKDDGIMSTLMSMLDPSENVVFKLMTLLLVGNIFEAESMTDVFMAVYIRVIGLALSIIAVIYVSTTFFG